MTRARTPHPESEGARPAARARARFLPRHDPSRRRTARPRYSVAPLALALGALAGCAPEPRWIAVADGRQLLLFDAALRPSATWSLPFSPRAVLGTADGAGLLVGGAPDPLGGLIAWVRRADGRLLAAALTGAPVEALWLERPGQRLFALAGGPLGTLLVRGARELEPQRAVMVCDPPVALAFSLDGDRAYVTCAPGAVTEVDAALGLAVRTQFVTADSGRSCGATSGALSPTGTVLVVSCGTGGRLLYLDRVTLQPFDSLDLAPGLGTLALGPGGLAAVSLPDSDRVLLLDLRRKSRLGSLATPPNPRAFALSASGRSAVVVAAGRGTAPGGLVLFDLPTGAVRARAPLPDTGATAAYVWPGPHQARLYWLPAR